MIVPIINLKITREENAQYFNRNVGDVVEIDFEKYIRGVVASEIGNSNINAAKAQAIAARTYAAYCGVLRGKEISDSSATTQAFRASRLDEKAYPNALIAARETAGMMLYYNNKPAVTVYSASNGGETVSYLTKWGKNIDYLTQKKDVWDANFGAKKNGHGVGMSQDGAKWAGANNFDYIDILNFYYPYTRLYSEYGEKSQLNAKDNEIKLTILKMRLIALKAINKLKGEL